MSDSSSIAQKRGIDQVSNAEQNEPPQKKLKYSEEVQLKRFDDMKSCIDNYKQDNDHSHLKKLQNLPTQQKGSPSTEKSHININASERGSDFQKEHQELADSLVCIHSYKQSCSDTNHPWEGPDMSSTVLSFSVEDKVRYIVIQDMSARNDYYQNEYKYCEYIIPGDEDNNEHLLEPAENPSFISNTKDAAVPSINGEDYMIYDLENSDERTESRVSPNHIELLKNDLNLPHWTNKDILNFLEQFPESYALEDEYYQIVEKADDEDEEEEVEKEDEEEVEKEEDKEDKKDEELKEFEQEDKEEQENVVL